VCYSGAGSHNFRWKILKPVNNFVHQTEVDMHPVLSKSWKVYFHQEIMVAPIPQLSTYFGSKLLGLFKHVNVLLQMGRPNRYCILKVWTHKC